MSKKTKESLKIVSQERIGKDIYSMWLQADHMAAEAKPGSFFYFIRGMEASCFPAPSVSVKLTEKTEESVLFIG